MIVRNHSIVVATFIGLASLGITLDRGEPQEPKPPGADQTFRVVITPERTVKARLSLDENRRIKGSKELKGQILDAHITEPLLFLGCAVVSAGASAKVKVEDASAPQKMGKPGYIVVKLVELTFADGESRELDGAVRCRAGVDKSDKGKILGIKDRKGGPAVLTADDELELNLVPGKGSPPPECGGGGGGAGGQPPQEPKPLVLYLAKSICH